MEPFIDPGVLRAARDGDPEAFRTLVERLSAVVYNMAYRVTFNAAEAHDLSQEILLRLYRNLNKYDPERPFLPWFRRVMVNTALNYRRSRRPVHALPETRAAEPPFEGLSSEEVRLIRNALRKLPTEYRLVIHFHYYESLELRDIARLLRTPVGTVKTWLFRARAALRDRLAARFQGEP